MGKLLKYTLIEKMMSTDNEQVLSQIGDRLFVR